MNEKLKKELDAASAAYNSWFSNWNTGGPRGGGVALMRMDEQGNGYIDTGMSLRGFTAGTRGDAMRGWQSDASYFNGMYNPSPTSQGIGRQLHKLMAKALAGDEEAARDYIDISRETISQPVGRSTSEASKWASKYGGGYNPPVAGINGKFAGGASNMVVGGSNRSQGTSSGRASVSSSSLPKTTLSSAGALVTTGGASQSTSRRGRKGKGSKGKGSKMKGGGAPITQSSKPVLKLDNNYNLSVGGSTGKAGTKAGSGYKGTPGYEHLYSAPGSTTGSGKAGSITALANNYLKLGGVDSGATMTQAAEAAFDKDGAKVHGSEASQIAQAFLRSAEYANARSRNPNDPLAELLKRYSRTPVTAFEAQSPVFAYLAPLMIIRGDISLGEWQKAAAENGPDFYKKQMERQAAGAVNPNKPKPIVVPANPSSPYSAAEIKELNNAVLARMANAGDKEALERLSKAPISTPVAPAPDDAAKETQALMSQPVMLISEEEKAKKEKETQGANKKFITKDGKTFQVNVKSGDLAQGMITEAQAGPGGYAGGQTAPTMGEKVQGGVTKPFINAQLEDGVTMEDVDKSYATLWQFQSGQSGMR